MLASLPRVLVAPRPGFAVVGAEVLDVHPDHAAVSSTRARAGEHSLIPFDARRDLLVDGNNVMGSRPDGWWRDRPGAARRLVTELQALVARTGDRVTVVFDGRPVPGLPEHPHAEHPQGSVRVAYARRAGPDSADDRIVEEVDAAVDASLLTVVTSDRELARRVRERGARVEGAGSLTRELGSERP